MATKMTREEAIKIVQSATVWTDEERDALAMLIPELAESEDERIRKWLVDYFSTIKEMIWIHRDITCEKILDWLEKQKEQKPAEWSEEDEKDMAHIIRILDDCYVYGTHDLSKTDHENLVNKLKSLRPSWKPSEEQMKALYDACCIAFEEERDFHPSLSRLYHDLRKL